MSLTVHYVALPSAVLERNRGRKFKSMVAQGQLCKGERGEEAAEKGKAKVAMI